MDMLQAEASPSGAVAEDKLMKIGRLAQLTGVSIKTIRRYEEMGLVRRHRW